MSKEEKEKLYTIETKLLALLSYMSKKGKKEVYKDDFVHEAIDLVADDYDSENSARGAVMYYLSKFIEDGEVKIENGKDGSKLLALQKEHSMFTLANVFPFIGITLNTVLAFILFTFGVIWSIATKEYAVIVMGAIYLFTSIVLFVSYKRTLIIKGAK